MSDTYHIYVDLVGMLVSLGIWSNGLVHDENTDIFEISFLKLEIGQWASRVVPRHRHFAYASEACIFPPFSLTPHKVACDSLDTYVTLTFPSSGSASNEYRVRRQAGEEGCLVLPA